MIAQRIATKALLTQLLGGLPRRGARVNTDQLLDIESPYDSDDGSQSPKRSNEGLLTSPGVPSIVEGVPPDADRIGEDQDDEFWDKRTPHPEGRGYAKPTCRRPAAPGGYPMPVTIAVAERFLRAEEDTEGLGCCKTTIPRRKQMRKRYLKHRKQELKERHKEHMKVRPETLERPGGRTHEKRKTYRPRNYPNSITQPDRLDDPHETRVNNPSKPRQAPQVREHDVEKPVQVRRITPT